MNPGLLTLFARLAWIEACILHFDRDAPEAVIAALGIHPATVAEARETLRVAMDAGRLRGDQALTFLYAGEVMRARAVLATRRPTLDEAATFVAVKVHDGLALPDVAIAEP